MMGYLCVALVLLVVAALWLWRRAERGLRARDHAWRAALAALATRDFKAAVRVGETLEQAPSARHLAVPLQETVAALEADEEEQLRTRHNLEDVLSSLQDAVLLVDDEARLRFLNAPAVQWFNVRIEDVLGAHTLEALPSFGLDAAIQTALTEGRSSEAQVNLYAPELREVFLRVSPVRRSDGRATGAVAILQDLTEMRRLERVRRDFVANASHELRTPIATIRATAETLMAAADDPEMTARFLPHLVSEAERLSRLVSDLLDLARSETSAESPHAPVDLSMLVRDVMRRLQGKAGQQHISLRYDHPDPMLVSGEAAGLEQVVFNLLDNAIMYTPSGGSITLEVAPAEAETSVDGSPAPASVQFSVRDTGIGIPPQDVTRIFERFYRVDKARSRAQGGTGLGLAIVKHIVENHGGHIKVESEVGQGTTFTVTLPAV